MNTKKKPTAKALPGKSRSARAKPHDWTALLEAIETDAHIHPALNFDEQYVHAIQRALEGRDTGPLLKLLDRGADGNGAPGSWLIPPNLGPALADVIRSQKDGARGAGKILTHHQDRMIRDLFDKVGPHLHPDSHPKATKEWLAKNFNTTVATINRSLNGTTPKAK